MRREVARKWAQRDAMRRADATRRGADATLSPGGNPPIPRNPARIVPRFAKSSLTGRPGARQKSPWRPRSVHGCVHVCVHVAPASCPRRATPFRSPSSTFPPPGKMRRAAARKWTHHGRKVGAQKGCANFPKFYVKSSAGLPNFSGNPATSADRGSRHYLVRVATHERPKAPEKAGKDAKTGGAPDGRESSEKTNRAAPVSGGISAAAADVKNEKRSSPIA